MRPTLILITGVAAIALTACSSGSGRYSSAAAPRAPVSLFATGPIYSACLQSDRKQANRAQCGCVQAVANQSLAADDQRRGAGFFKNPHQAQEVRTSNRAIDERFWLRWKAFGDSAAQICR
ncbi:hypothetical protein ACERZ8_02710 [Tateyamaria armeniaca]|uniref:Arginine transporter n=1 Tax=Tateyamaria armeniaca TaxID=2518930 RepID=A0ABW8UT44_9RHOB